MNKRVREIRSFLLKAKRRFGNLKFRCGVEVENHTYIVEVDPVCEFDNNDEYAKMELEFTDTFEQKYGDDIIFVTERDLCKVMDCLFEIGYENTPHYMPDDTKFDFNLDSWMKSYSKINDYSLAA